MDSNNVGQVSISVIVAAYNVSKFIRECLESLISQTEQFAEFVVVDDASTDGTEKICDEYEKKDSRIRIVRHKENKGSLAARKSGIEKAKGRYITFLDGDDIFTRQDALSLLADQMNKEGCDIGVFGVVLLGEAGIRRSGLEKWLSVERVEKFSCRDDIIRGMFSKNFKVSWNVCSKCFRAEVLRKTLDYIPDASIRMAEDALLSYLFAFFSKDLIVLSVPSVYGYRVGVGISTSHASIELFKKQVHEFEVVRHLECFANKVKGSGVALECLGDMLYRFIEGSLCQILRLPSCDQKEAFEVLMNQGFDLDVVSVFQEILDRDVTRLSEFSRNISFSKISRNKISDIRTIGIYCYRGNCVGVEHTCALYIPWFLRMGYKLVLLTDGPDEDSGRHLQPDVQRAVLPEKFSDGRASALFKAIETHQIDVLIHDAANSPNLFFDLLVTKRTRAHAVVLRHELTFENLGEPSLSTICTTEVLPYIYSHASSLIVPSRMEQELYQSMGVPTRYMPEPLSGEFLRCAPSEPQGNTVLWVGPLDFDQKGLTDALAIIKRVAEVRPETRFDIVGSEYSEGSEKRLKKFIEKNNLQDNVTCHSGQLDAARFYKKAAVQLCTSKFESFSMQILEGKAFGVPLVTFDMPYQDLLREKKGYIPVAQHDVEAAARNIVRILNDKELRANLSQAAWESSESFVKYDFERAWKEIFDSLLKEPKPTELSEAQKFALLRWQNQFFCLREGFQKLKQEGRFPYKSKAAIMLRNLAHDVRDTLRVVRRSIKSMKRKKF